MMIRFTYSLDAHAAVLKRRLAEIDAHGEAGAGEREDARARLHNALAADFAAYRDLIRRAFVRLKRLGAGLPAAVLTPALADLAAGDTRAADRLLCTIEIGDAEAGERAAAAVMRGRIAEAEVRWRDAARHYATAARLAPAEATLKDATRMAARIGDVAMFDHFAAQRIKGARAEHAEDSPEREAILEDVLLQARVLPSTLDLDMLHEETIGRWLRRAGLDRPGAFIDRLIEELDGDPAIDVSLLPSLRYREARRRVLRLRGRRRGSCGYATALLDLAQATLWTGQGRAGLVLARAAAAVRKAELGAADPQVFAALDQVGVDHRDGVRAGRGGGGGA